MLLQAALRKQLPGHSSQKPVALTREHALAAHCERLYCRQVALPYLRAKLDGLYARHARSHEALPGLGAFQRR
jgi:hypothetical protein